jgi:hypothetical protein
VVGEADGAGEVVLGAGVGVVAVAVGDGELVVFYTVGVGVVAGAWRGSRDWPLAAAAAVTVVKAAAAAVPAVAVSMPGQAAASRTAPARKVATGAVRAPSAFQVPASLSSCMCKFG